MNLINFNHREDYGHEWCVQILNTGKHLPKLFKNLSLIQASVSWNDYPDWPAMHIRLGSGGGISVYCWAYKFGFDIAIIDHTWNWGNYE